MDDQFNHPLPAAHACRRGKGSRKTYKNSSKKQELLAQFIKALFAFLNLKKPGKT